MDAGGNETAKKEIWFLKMTQNEKKSQRTIPQFATPDLFTRSTSTGYHQYSYSSEKEH